MDPSKVQAVLEWQAPRTRRQLQSFLGFANFYRHFIPSFATVAHLLTELLRTKHLPGKPRPNQPLEWTMVCQHAFESLKTLFAKEPILRHPDPNALYVVQADASDVAVGAVLLQRNSKGGLQPCAYTSRKFTTAERGWAIWEKEAFAVRWALTTWRHLLEGTTVPFEVWTDHKNLEALQTPRRLAPKHVRWAQYFGRFKFTLKYVPGGRNFLADALSRMPQFHSKREDVVQALMPPCNQGVARVVPQTRGSEELANLRVATAGDMWLHAHPGTLTQRDGLAWKGDKTYVPEVCRRKVLQRCHDAKQAGHFGFLKTLHLVRRQFWWPRLKPDVENYVKECHICASAKPRVGKPIGLLQKVADPTRPWEEIAMDFVVELPNNRGYNVIWTVVDLFSKQAHFIPCKGLPSARRLARLFIQHVYRLHGIPRRIISDRGVQFTAQFWRDFIRLVGSSQGLSSAYHPSTNGAAERANAMVERYLRSYVTFQQTDWVDLLPFAEVAYNNTVHSSTGCTPFRVVHGMDFVPIPEWPQSVGDPHTPQTWVVRIAGLWGRVKEALIKAEKTTQEQANRKRAEHKPFQVGEWVYLSTKYLRLQIPCKKLGPKYVGPFQISKVINPVTVQLRLPSFLGKVHPVFHGSLLKPVHGIPHTAKAPGPVTGSQYEVQEVLDSRVRRGRVQYLLLWKGYPLSEATWVGEEDVHAPQLLRAFHRQCPEKPGGGKGLVV